MKLGGDWLRSCQRISWMTLVGVMAISGESAIAQSNIVPDTSLGNGSSQVRTNTEIQGNPAEIIEGGAQRGVNLFHSFEEFNVENGRGAYFANPAGIENIFGRVTGSNPSEILGTLGVSGNADLFLINPNGIIFGQNARLDLGGSFWGSTASSILFEDGEFGATDPDPPLLTVNVPIGLGFQNEPGDIINRSTVQNSSGEIVGLEVNPGKNITLLGGNIDLENGNITARGGKIKLGGLTAAGTVGINNGSLDPEDTRVDITLSNAADIDVRGSGGSIEIEAGSLILEDGENLIRAGIINSDAVDALAGDININADRIAVNAGSIANLVEAGGVGNGGNINITTTDLSLTNGGRVEASTFGRGDSGVVRVNSEAIAIDTGEITGLPSGIFSQVKPSAVGNSGGVEVTTTNLTLTNGGRIASNTGGVGNAGGVNITAKDTIIDGRGRSDGLPSGIVSRVDLNGTGNSGNVELAATNLTLTSGGRIEANTLGRGDSGVVRVESEAIAIDTGEITGLASGIFSQVEPSAVGNSGGVEVTTTDLSLTNGGRIASNTRGTGNAGGVDIAAIDTTLDGRRERADIRLASGIASLVDPSAEGDSGGIEVTTTNLDLTGGARIEANTIGRGDSGVVKVNGETIAIDTGEIEGLPSGIFSQVEPSAVGNSGGVEVTTTDLTLTNGGRIASNTGGVGNAGGVDVTASGTVSFDGERSVNNVLSSGVASLVDLDGTGNSGGVNITAANISMTNGGEISATTFGRGNAGQINITASNNLTFDGENSIGQGSGVRSSVERGATGDAGSVSLEAANITMTNGGRAVAGTFGEGDAGEVNIAASNNITFDGEGSNGRGSGANSSINPGATGKAGGVNITTANLTLTNGGRADVSTKGQGNAGAIAVTATDTIKIDGEGSNPNNRNGITSIVNKGVDGNSEGITIDTKNLILSDGGEISATTFGRGNAGQINITATDTITLDGERNSVPEGSKISSNVEETGVGNSGGITISTKNLTLTNGGVISAGTVGRGNAGVVDITATDTIKIDGVDSQGFGSGITSLVRPKGVGSAGDLKLDTAFLSVSNGGRVSVNTLGQGNAGDLTVEASEAIALDGTGQRFRSSLSANALVDSGRGGNISVSADRLTIEDGAAIEAGNFDSLNTTDGFESGTGQPGKISIEAKAIALVNEARIEAATQSVTGIGGIVNLIAEDIVLRDRSFISAEAFNNANGGNLNIDARFIIASFNENNDIIASAAEGRGGEILVEAVSLFGITERPRSNPRSNLTNDISASSNVFGLDGTVEIDTLEVNPNRDLLQLPERAIAREIVLACDFNSNREQSEFVIKGSGGLPPNPEAPLDSDVLAVDWISRQPGENPEIGSTDPNTPIVEAQGWMVNQNNEIVLVANDSPTTPWQMPQCQKHSFQNILIASIEPKSLTAIPQSINVNRFEVEGNTVFNAEELDRLLAPYTDKPLSFSQLLQARSAITKYYTDRGYITSGAYLPPQKLQDEVVKLQIIEGYLEDIEITGNQRLNSNYLSSRLQKASNTLQQEELLAALQLLQQDPLIDTISAELEAGSRPGAGILAVKVTEADSFTTSLAIDNRRAPSVGSFRRQLAINQGNLWGFGDNLSLAYSNTVGSDAFDGSYAIPLNASNGTLTIRGGVSGSEVVEAPFNQLNILGDSHYYELALRQPVIQTPSQELALGITASRRQSDISSLLEAFDIPPSELSPGADENGQTRVSALRFFQEWTIRNRREVIAARSQFSLGLGIFDATVNEAAPDSRFLAWQGQAQWTRQIATDTSVLIRGGVQLATTSLLASERFGLGGANTIRGYRQDLLLTDNAAFASAEVRLPVLRIDRLDGVVQLAPFVDLGTAWNNDSETIEPNIASIGVGLRLLLANFAARLDWGIPLVSVDRDKNTWQENGLHFSLEYNPF